MFKATIFLQVERQLIQEEVLKSFFNSSEIRVLKILLIPVSYYELVNNHILDEFASFYDFEKYLNSLCRKLELFFQVESTLNKLLPKTNCFSSKGIINNEFKYYYRKSLGIRQAYGLYRQPNSTNNESSKDFIDSA